jgi:hypothetical protein
MKKGKGKGKGSGRGRRRKIERVGEKGVERT